ncbi:hypothetical protein BT63DRAFT_375325 [Microthyrium microscopicum]|uniref:SH3 domain-containing protein n=1 Tax=Microthyrium microscopicum TaxID=703497 RepID=A0A6A6U760_9PEZI|nr:hypothetical protein BT63DRAFT_375325 [Microthyrium microscopicum]
MAPCSKPTPSPRSDRAKSSSSSASWFSFALLAALPSAMAQQCVSLSGSTVCPAFNQSSVSTNTQLRGLYPFLAFVSDVKSFDSQLQSYISTGYSQQKYQDLLGCSSVNLTNTTNLYARYTTTYICNAIVQNSVTPCGLSGASTKPMCADSCASFATSEETIASTPSLCGSATANALNQIRADFTTCALPPDSLTANCIHGAQNEPDNCGFSGNTPSLCAYCAASSPNATDSCCIYSQSETRCQGVHLPVTTTMGNFLPSATGNATASHNNDHHGLSGGAIAGIVIGSIIGALLLIALIAFLLTRKRRGSVRSPSIFNQPSPTRGRPGMAYASPAQQRDIDLPQGARVHQMTALEGSSSTGDAGSPLAGGYLGSSSNFDNTPESQRSGLGVVGGAPKRGGSLSRDHNDLSSSSPNYGSSPEGPGSGQSEQMSHFKDYYSSDDIHPGDSVATLWAYQPRAGDEWELERGDMLKVVGIWDDGWATGYKLNSRAEDYEGSRNVNRDSGLSAGSRRDQQAEVGEGDIKAFPLVCVCLPQHWRKTIEGDAVQAEMGSGSGGHSPGGSP